MKKEVKISLTLIFILFFLSSCSYNPFYKNNTTTGSAAGAVIGAGAAGGSVALLGGSKPLIALSSLGGGALGYYMTTLRYEAGPIYYAGGQVYKLGNFVGIYIPSDKLFEANTADFLPQAPLILCSAETILKRYPNNNIMVSGSTSGFANERWELSLSEARAQKVAAYLWKSGINGFMGENIDTRRLNYVGYGDFFPIAHDYTNKSIRQNSRIQITSYPSDVVLHTEERRATMRNIGGLQGSSCGQDQNCFDPDTMPPSHDDP